MNRHLHLLYPNAIILASILIVVSMGSSCSEKSTVTPPGDTLKGRANEPNISRYGDTTSHYTGSNCMICHSEGGQGKGWFTVGGTLYQGDQVTPYPNQTIRLYSDSNAQGTMLAELQVDGNGNFFTTDSVPFGNGVYPSILTKSGKRKFMPGRTFYGDCNSCHSAKLLTPRIWIDSL